jgi:predicted tellurium resistance membrane protein TerC
MVMVEWFGWIFTVEGWIGLITLTLLEIVLGIDNLVFLTIAAGRLPRAQRPKAQKLGLLGALVLRIVMLAMLVWLTKLVTPIAQIGSYTLTWRDVILMLGGLFLLWKGTTEIHQEVEGGEEGPQKAYTSSFMGVIAMIMVIDFIFALDSIVTAVGMTDVLPIMILANVFAIILMLVSARTIGEFIDQHPTVKMLALAFILLVGVALVADGMHFHIPREYIYFAIAFSLGVEFLNMLVRTRGGGVAKAKQDSED